MFRIGRKLAPDLIDTSNVLVPDKYFWCDEFDFKKKLVGYISFYNGRIIIDNMRADEYGHYGTYRIPRYKENSFLCLANVRSFNILNN